MGIFGKLLGGPLSGGLGGAINPMSGLGMMGGPMSGLGALGGLLGGGGGGPLGALGSMGGLGLLGMLLGGGGQGGQEEAALAQQPGLQGQGLDTGMASPMSQTMTPSMFRQDYSTRFQGNQQGGGQGRYPNYLTQYYGG